MICGGRERTGLQRTRKAFRGPVRVTGGGDGCDGVEGCSSAATAEDACRRCRDN